VFTEVRMVDRIKRLQSDATGDVASVSSLLRQMLVISSELGLEEVSSWVTRELHGYKDTLIPEYRRVIGQPSIREANGHMHPIVAQDEKTASALSDRGIKQPIPELEHVARSDGTLVMNYPASAMGPLIRLIPDLEYRGVPVIEIHRVHIQGILDRVRTMIVEWTIQASLKGIRDHQEGFSQESKQDAQALTLSIQSFQGVLNASQSLVSSTTSHNDLYLNLTQAGLPDPVVQELKEMLDELRVVKTKADRDGVKRGVGNWLKEHAPAIGSLAQVVRTIAELSTSHASGHLPS
jgi:hypothetical protein